MSHQRFIQHLEWLLEPYLHTTKACREALGGAGVALPLPVLHATWYAVQDWLNARGLELRIHPGSVFVENTRDQPEKLRDLFLRCAVDEPCDPLPSPAAFRRNANHIHNLQALWLAFQSMLTNYD